MASHPHRQSTAMSMESSLDEERREVLALLALRAGGGGGNSRAPRPLSMTSAGLGSGGARSSSPYLKARSPIRSMLDIAGESTTAQSPPRMPSVRSMLDVDDEPAVGSPRPGEVQSGPASPVLESATMSLVLGGAGTHHPRSFSDAGMRLIDSATRSGLPKVGDYASSQFHQHFVPLITNHGVPAMPKRVTQAPRRSTGGLDYLGGDSGPGDRGRHLTKGPPHPLTKSVSPPSRPDTRSRSPYSHIPPSSHVAMLDDGTVVDLNNAYRRLSDANLANSGGSLSQLAHKKKATDLSGRLNKDWITEDAEFEDTTDDDPVTSDDEDRGRKRVPQKADGEKAPALTLLGAAEEERLKVAARRPRHQYRSLLDEPTITVTNPSGDKTTKPSKPEVHPSTSFEAGLGSANASGIDSDDAADVEDIHRAQKMSFSMTPIIARPDTHRAIRIIYRGEYNKIVQAAEDDHRPLRKYVVATDLSDESTHALEWAVGTVLRDGDTMIAIYCVDEETGIGVDSQVPDDPKAMRETAVAVNALASSRTPPPSVVTFSASGPTYPHLPRAQPLAERSGPFPSSATAAAGGAAAGGAAAGGAAASGAAAAGGTAAAAATAGAAAAGKDVAGNANGSGPGTAGTSRERNRAEDERFHAVQAITDKVVKLLRKTRLQVRVTVEVMHCKNPKHLITEVIDLTSPTLVILGSRGRNALKGVILGSFSNYLVTKSSAPVMVARKRLRKQKKYKTKFQPQVNNISGPAARKLSNAKVD